MGGGISELAEGDGEKRVLITGTTISNNTAKTAGGGIALSSSHGGFITAVLDTVTVKNNVLNTSVLSDSVAGAGIYFGGGYNNKATLTIKGGSITGNRTDHGIGGGICIRTNSFDDVYGTLTLKDGVRISGNTAKNGGGIAVRSATLVIEPGCTIGGTAAEGNTAANKGGGIYTEGGTVTMTGGTVAQNKAASVAGGIYAQKSGTTAAAVTIKGGTIEGNTATNGSNTGSGGGICIDADCTLTVQDNAEIKGNTADIRGGGVYIFDGEFTMSGGEIKGNNATNSGGGVCILGGKFTMSGGKIKGNNAQFGGGIYAEEHAMPAAVTIKGGTIEGNTATIYGNGVYVKDNTATFTLAGAATVDTGNDVYLAGTAMITVNGALSNDPVARITVPDGNYQTSTQVLTGSAVSSEHSKFRVTPNGSQNWSVGNDGRLKMTP